MYLLIVCLLIVPLLTACEKQELPPAIPEQRTVFEPPPPPAQVVPEPLTIDEGVPITETPVIKPTQAELTAIVPKPSGTRVTEKPETVITNANKGATITPSGSGYADSKSVVQKYPYFPGRIYEVYSSPNSPTAIILPRGERLAAAPAMASEQWDVGVIEMSEGDTRQEVVIVRPLSAGQEATTHLFLQSGRALYLRLKSFPQTSMTAVSWDMPQVPRMLSAPSARPQTPPGEQRSVVGQGSLFPLRPNKESAPGETPGPLVDPSRLHTAYSIEVVKGKPAWVPIAVYDDGTRTVIRFATNLNFTAAPAPFATNADGTAGLVQFTPYNTGEADKGTIYVINGLFPVLELKGSDGQIVKITRITGQPKPYKEQQ